MKNILVLSSNSGLMIGSKSTETETLLALTNRKRAEEGKEPHFSVSFTDVNAINLTIRALEIAKKDAIAAGLPMCSSNCEHGHNEHPVHNGPRVMVVASGGKLGHVLSKIFSRIHDDANHDPRIHQ